MKISAVLFDVDGTLLNTERIYMQSWRLAAKEAGYDLPEEALTRTRAVDAKLSEKIFQSCCGEAFDYHKIWMRRVELSEEIIFSTPPETLLKPGAEECLAFLREHGVRKAIASMTLAKRTFPHLEYTGLLAESLCGRYPVPGKKRETSEALKFDTVLTGDDVQHGKPDPEIFLKTAALLGVRPEECAVVEDSAAGVRAGAAAGMQVYMIPDCVPVKEEDRDYLTAVLGSLAELPGQLQ